MKKKIILKTSINDELVGYLYLPKHPKTTNSGLVKKSIALSDVLKDYKGIPLYLDFDEDDELVGIEISG